MKKSLVFMVANMNVGGTEKSLLSLLSIIPKEEYDITVLLLEKNGGYLDYIPNWVKIETVEGFDKMKAIINDPPLKNIKYALKSFQFLSALHLIIIYIKVKITKDWSPFYTYALKNYRRIKTYDIAVAFAGPSNFISYFIAYKIVAKKKLQWIHFDVTQIGLKKKFGEKYYTLFDKIYCVSEGARKEMINYFPMFRDKISTFENIVSKQSIQDLAVKGQTFNDNYSGTRILTLGRLSQEKGQLMIPNVIEKLKQDGFDFKWYCIGDGIIRNEIESLIKEKRIEKELILLGLQKNPYRFMMDTDIYVQTSFHEGYGLTIHEAKICLCPMVITQVASAKDLITNNKTGLIVPINEEGIYNGVKKLLSDNKLRKGLKEALTIENITHSEPIDIQRIF